MSDEQEALTTEIMRDALGDLYDWKKPIAKSSIGPSFPELADQFQADLNSVRGEIVRILAAYSVDDLRERYRSKNSELKYLLSDENGHHSTTAKKIQNLQKTKPAWFISGWHVDAHELELAHWRGFSSVTVAELTLLSVGLDARFVNFDALFKRYGHLPEQDLMLHFLEDRYEAIANGLSADPRNENSTVDMAAFFAWASDTKLQLEDRFRRMLKAKFAGNSKSATDVTGTVQRERNPKKMHKSQYDFHARLLYAIAAQRFGLKDAKGLGRVASQIEDCALQEGFTATRQPIKALLQRGLELSSEME